MRNKYKIFSFVTILLFCISGNFWIACSNPYQKIAAKSKIIDIEELKSRLVLETEVDPDSNSRISRGTFSVFEDRESQKGRQIKLDVVILHATGSEPKPDPVFDFDGGPGADVTRRARGYEEFWIREEHDIVLVSQRGTGGDNLLDCELAATDDDLQGYLDPLFTIDNFRACLQELQKKFDLTKYSTCLAADDINDVRLAIGYDKINVTGGSYGTRIALVYMRRHPETVRTAILNGVAPIAFKNPLFHAPAFHEAVQLLMAECSNDPECHEAFPNLEDEFLTIMDRLEKDPVETKITHPVSGERVSVELSKDAFIEALRTMMYSRRRSRSVPMLIHSAFKGDFEPFAQTGMESSRGIRRYLALGMLLSVICAEDIARITEEEIVKITNGTYPGDGRVRRQKAVCDFWPQSDIPKNYGDPVSVDVPVLLLSGTLDPVTPPRFGADAASHLPDSLHIVAPGAHGVGGTCITGIRMQFLATGSVRDIDISCVEDMRKLSFIVSKE